MRKGEMRTVILAAVVLLATGQQSRAQILMGVGAISCGEWLQFRSAQTSNGNVQQISVALQAEAWIDGFLSGFNIGKPPGPDLLQPLPNGFALNAWVDNYCKSKPLDAIGSAAIALVKDLQHRARQ
jgi:hypothetical protein